MCIPGYWQLTEGCVTCPSGYEWNGICCQARGGYLKSMAGDTDPMFAMSVPVMIR